MGYITEQCKQRVIDAADVHGVISDFIQLHKKGAGFWACCPFHGEKSPSLNVSPSKNLWHCFGCGRGGDAIKFVMELQNIDFQDAVADIAKKNGINVDYVTTELSEEQIAEAKHRESLLIAIEQVQEYFVSSLEPDAKANE